jgi:hypothetical protein
MTLLQETLRTYALAKDVQPERYRVDCAPAHRFSFALNALTRSLGDEAENPLWELVLASGRAARWRAGAEGIPFDAPSSGAREPLNILMGRATALAELVEGEAQHILQQLGEAAAAVLGENNTALSTAILQCLQDGDPKDTCVIASNGRTAQAIAGWLAACGLALPVLKPRDFMTGRRWDFAVVVGAADWFPGQMFTCPRAEALTLVHHAHLKDSANVEGIFERFATVPLAVRVRDPQPWTGKPPDLGQATSLAADEVDSAAAQSPQPQWSGMTQQVPRAAVGEEQVEARLVVLGAGYGMWLPIDAVSIRGLDLSAPAGERVISLRTASITSDAVLIVREGGSVSGTLAAMADAALGKRATAIRQRQQEWKTLLRQELARVGAANLQRQLRRAGSTTANLRFWAGDENIRPQYDHDFAVLLKHLGILDPVPYLLDGRELWRAHHKAGVQLSAALEAALEAADLTELEARGRQQLHLSDQAVRATLTAFRVIAVQPETVSVASSATRKTFRLKGAQWLE